MNKKTQEVDLWQCLFIGTK